jgi:hypothetical protein
VKTTDSRATEAASIPNVSPSREANSRPAEDPSLPNASTPDEPDFTDRQHSRDTLRSVAIGDQQAQDRAALRGPSPSTATLLDPALALAADFLDDVERVRMANANRLRALTATEIDSDGVKRYVGLDVDHPVVAQLAMMVESLTAVEHAATLNLQRMIRKHPLGAWIKATKGVGEKQGARLLASIGDPYWRPTLTRADGTVIPAGPRTVSALWAYCGLHVLSGDHASVDTHDGYVAGDPTGTGGDSGHWGFDTQGSCAGVAARRRKGQQANWSTKAKTRAYLIAESAMKTIRQPCEPNDHADDCACSPYRCVYDQRKAHTTLTRPDWTDGHRHADALRVASKEILKDLWRAGRHWHLTQALERSRP